jgi:hypothetical protein
MGVPIPSAITFPLISLLTSESEAIEIKGSKKKSAVKNKNADDFMMLLLLIFKVVISMTNVGGLDVVWPTDFSSIEKKLILLPY